MSSGAYIIVKRAARAERTSLNTRAASCVAISRAASENLLAAPGERERASDDGDFLSCV